MINKTKKSRFLAEAAELGLLWDPPHTKNDSNSSLSESAREK
jgi:hypothetical protein